MSAPIASVETFDVRYPVQGRFKFFERPAGLPPGRPTVVVKVTAEDGLVGWGQCVPSPRWSYETPETVASTIKLYLAPLMIGAQAAERDRLHQAWNQAIAPGFSTGQPIAKAGLDIALWDLQAKQTGQSIRELWHIRGRDTIALSWTLNPARPADLPEQIALARGRGYTSFNIKVAPDAQADLQLCRRVRELAPDAHLWADANGGYDLETALVVAPALADLGMAALEQPLPANRLAGMRRLKRQGALPLLLDEPIVSRADLEEFIELGLLDGVAMKVARSAGLTESLRIADLVKEANLLLYGSGLTDPDISLAASLALFGACDLAVPAALNGAQFLTTSILREPLRVANGCIRLPAGPGLGIEVDEAAMRQAS